MRCGVRRLSSSICVVTTCQESHLNLFEQGIVKDRPQGLSSRFSSFFQSSTAYFASFSQSRPPRTSYIVVLSARGPSA